MHIILFHISHHTSQRGLALLYPIKPLLTRRSTTCHSHMHIHTQHDCAESYCCVECAYTPLMTHRHHHDAECCSSREAFNAYGRNTDAVLNAAHVFVRKYHSGCMLRPFFVTPVDASVGAQQTCTLPDCLGVPCLSLRHRCLLHCITVQGFDLLQNAAWLLLQMLPNSAVHTLS